LAGNPIQASGSQANISGLALGAKPGSVNLPIDLIFIHHLNFRSGIQKERIAERMPSGFPYFCSFFLDCFFFFFSLFFGLLSPIAALLVNLAELYHSAVCLNVHSENPAEKRRNNPGEKENSCNDSLYL
jgi:hypothetical protein